MLALHDATLPAEAPAGGAAQPPGDNMRECIQTFAERNGGCPPERIVFYRDGVAHNQFELVARQEVGLIHQALIDARLEGRCELIFIVVQKKTNARFAMEDGIVPRGGGKGGGKGGGVLGNVHPGTVIDTDITDREGVAGFDFYMVSQASKLGTARPSHYHVLHCPPSLTQDEIQRFTFDLCVLYARCTKIVGRPAPVYYAHRAASFGPYYDGDYRDGAIEWDAVSSSSGGSGNRNEKRNISAVREELRGALYYA
mmetsp:Transcript_56464/g.150144  ORF Transcript_56464/g.150144 Transcript_56464/m.150144 type:complete len:255 (-) Transcript_56464:235-999(-)